MTPEEAKRDRLMRVDQVMAIMMCSDSTVYRLLADAHLTGVKVRGAIRVWESSVWGYLTRHAELLSLESEDIVSDSSVPSGPLDGEGNVS
jgi:excisionase family DNA binding protein